MGASLWMNNHYACGCPACKSDSASLTYNCSPILYAAGHVGHRDMLGVRGSVAALLYRNVLIQLQATPIYFECMNPKNGWGSYEKTIKFVTKMIDMCNAHPADDIDGSI